MWQAMSPNQTPPNMQQSTTQPQTFTSTGPDGVKNIFVHHMHPNGAPPQPAAPAAPQMMGIPFPMPMQMPAPPPMFMPPPMHHMGYHGHGGCHHHQPYGGGYGAGGPQVVVIEPPTPEPVIKEVIKFKEVIKVVGPPPPLPPQRFSKFSIASVIIFALALIFGVVCCIKAYEADEFPPEMIGGEQYEEVRIVCVGTGATATLCFSISTLLSFYAGMVHRAKSQSKKSHCLVSGLVLSGWIIFCMTFMLDLICLVLAFDPDNLLDPAPVWTALIGSILNWMLMFSYSELTRRVGIPPHAKK